MKKILQFAVIATTVVAAFTGCSEDSSIAGTSRSEQSDSQKSDDNRQASETPTHEDSSKVVVYSYEEFVDGDEVQILDDDTTKLSIDMDFAETADSIIPAPGNVVVIWNEMLNYPYYLRVKTIKKESSRYVLTVDKACAFEAVPTGDYDLSSEMYIDSSAKLKSGRNSMESFYNEDEKTFHPFLIIEDVEESEDDGNAPVPLLRSTSGQKNVIDLRKPRLTSGSIDYTYLNIDKELHPGIIEIPGLGKVTGDYQGGWLDAFGGMEKLEAAFKKSKGLNDSTASALKAYVRMDTVRFKAKSNFHLSWTTDWGIKGFEFYVKGNTSLFISNIGGGLGVGVSGEKKLTDFAGTSFTFWVYGVPIRIDIKPNLFFKYKANAYLLLDYNLQYHKETSAKVGVSWKSGNGVNIIKESKDSTYFNESKDFKEFISNSHVLFSGNGSAGIYLRVAALLYNIAGPTVGIGGRLELDGKVGAAVSFDENGEWTGEIPQDDGAHLQLDGVVGLEAGAEVSLLGETIFKKSYDIYDIYRVTLAHWEY